MRRLLTVTLAVLTMGLVMAPAVGAGAEKVEVCHLEGTGEFHLISIADPAFDAHVAHGDGTPGGPVPGMAGYVFDEACLPVEALSVSVFVEWLGTVGTLTASGDGLVAEYGGEFFTLPEPIYHSTYWGTHGLYLPEQEGLPVVNVDITGVEEATLTVAFDVFQINQDGTVGTGSTPYPGSSFQHSFTAVDGTTTQIVPAGVAPDVTPPYGFTVVDYNDPQFLHLATARIYAGPDTTGELLLTVQSIIDLA